MNIIQAVFNYDVWDLQSYRTVAKIQGSKVSPEMI